MNSVPHHESCWYGSEAGEPSLTFCIHKASHGSECLSADITCGRNHLRSCGIGKTSVSSRVQGPEGEEPTQALVAIDSLGGKSMHLYLHKRKGLETEDVLEGDLEKEGG